MSSFFEGSEEKQYIPPDYESPPDDDPDDSDDTDLDEIGDEEVSDEDEGKVESEIDKIEEEKKVITGPTFGGGGNQSQPSSPWSAPSFGSGGNNPSPFGGSSSPWGGGSKPSIWNSGTTWGGSQNNNNQKEQINREKKVIFCDFLDCIVETWDSQGRPGYLPRDIYDLKARFEVWAKIQAFNPDMVYSLIPINLIPNTNGAEGWIKTLEYFCCSLSAYLRVPYSNCKILAQTKIGQPKEELIESILSQGVSRNDAIYIGIYSGLAGQSNRDQLAAQRCSIDYIDLGILLNNMY